MTTRQLPPAITTRQQGPELRPAELQYLEGSFLGAMIETGWKHLPAVEGYLDNGQAFESEFNRQVYLAGRRLGAKGELPNIIEELGIKRLQAVGGASKISEYVSWAGHLLGRAAIIDAARRIAERAERRKAIAAGTVFLNAIQGGESLESASLNLETALKGARAVSAIRLLQNITPADELGRKEFPPVRWAVPEIIPEGLTILAGKPKAGKSTLALSLAASCACGGFALGTVQVEAGPVLYLGLEDPERRLQTRLARMMGGREWLPRNLHLVAIGGWARLDQGGLSAIAAWLDSHPNARMVVIDTLAKIRPPRKGGRQGDLYAEDYAVLEGLQELAVLRGVAIVVVHHLRKAVGDEGVDEVSGSAGLTGCADGVATLKRNGDVGELKVIGRDLEKDVELALQPDPATGAWRITGDLAEVKLSQERLAVTVAIEDAGNPLTPSDVALRLGKNVNAVKKLMWTMKKDRQLTDCGKGKYGLPTLEEEASGDDGNPGNPSNPGNRGNRRDEAGYPVTRVTDDFNAACDLAHEMVVEDGFEDVGF